jgi:hypothetical protein
MDQTPNPSPNPRIPNLLQRSRDSRLPDPAPAPKFSSGSFGSGFSWKLIVFDVLAVILAAALGYSCLLYFAGGINFILFLVLAALFLLASFFAFLLTPDPRRRLVVAFLQMLAFLVFFYAVKPSTIAAAALILAVFYFMGSRESRGLAENSLKFRMRPVARAYMKKIFLGLAIAVIILYLPQGSSGNVFVSRERFQQWYNGTTELVERFYSGIDLGSSVGAFTEDIVRAQVSFDPQFQALPPDLQEEAIRQGARELVSSTARDIGFVLTPEMPLAEAFYKYLLERFTEFREQFGQSFTVVWGVALFAIVWSLGTVFIWIVIGFALIVYELLAALNIVRVVGETRTKEIVQLS